MEYQPLEHVVQYYETDQMQVVHHSNYVRWFEEARTHWMDQAGMSYARMEELGIIIPVLTVSAKYVKMCRFGERVLVDLTVEEFNGIKAAFSYQVREADTWELRCTGTSSHCFLDRNNRPMSLKKKYPDIHELFVKWVR